MRDNGHASPDQEILFRTDLQRRVARAEPFLLKNLHVTAKLKDPTMHNLDTALDLDTALAANGRFLIAALFLLSGVAKIAAPAMIEDYIASAGLPAPLLGYPIAIIVEVGGGLLLLVGFQTRIVALILAGFALAAALAFHNKFSDPNEMIHFLKDIAIIDGLLQVAAFGPPR